jgi:predicted nucleic acid-binding Zn ribbon protein
MQKLSDAPLTVCTACGQSTFSKQITAAGFQLKGSGWYATDFKNGSKGAKKETTEPASGDKPAEKVSKTKAGETKTGETKTGETKTTESSTEKKTETKTDSGGTKSTARTSSDGRPSS